ncbi:MAG: hypothetical protein E7616_04410 [Ruminococcaceae bacterium]|nr:hypothetical protein [Oscillospiraceae bacterium]
MRMVSKTHNGYLLHIKACNSSQITFNEVTKQIYDTTLRNLQRIAMQTGTYDPQEMYVVQRAEFEANYEIFSLLFPGLEESEVKELIKYE